LDDFKSRYIRDTRKAEMWASVGVIAIVVLVIATVYVAWHLPWGMVLGDQSVPARPGAPLDALRYKAPSWADGDVLEVVDRDSGSSWWVLHVDGETLVLPVTVRDMDIRQIGG
jgi:hypothetical protein